MMSSMTSHSRLHGGTVVRPLASQQEGPGSEDYIHSNNRGTRSRGPIVVVRSVSVAQD
ncbi:hypothetical protein EXN66_Car013864 [Channa argus]|uniref:Uncharacterized protein n=1 Tax=Channa argus TaxID=215402 RepID=A0A6G1Q764_CHAAH|nr:hypothetical protein EXN66_Car013864 [Channa argus]